MQRNARLLERQSPLTQIRPSHLRKQTSDVISAAADIDPTLASQARKEPSKVSDGPTRPAKVPRKVKANKGLEVTIGISHIIGRIEL